MTQREQIVNILKELQSLEKSGDPEAAHSRADDLLMSLIEIKIPDLYQQIRCAYDNVPRWYA